MHSEMVQLMNESRPDTFERKWRKLTVDYQDRLSLASRYREADGRRCRDALQRYLTFTRRQFLPHYFSSPPKWRLLLRSLVADRAMPDFFVIGPGKSGTSDLAVSLMSHPNVLAPLAKEVDGTDPLAWKPYFPTLKAVHRHEMAHGIALCPLVGPYLHCLDLALNVARLLPKAKVVIHLRNPVELVFSHWKWIVLHTEGRLIESSPFLATFAEYVDAAITAFPGLHTPIHPALHNGIYWYSVSRWLNCFSPRQVIVLNAADYFASRTSYLQRIEQFVGLPSVAIPRQLPIANRNPLLVPAPEEASLARLRKFFEPYNSRLWGVIGTSFAW